MSGKKIAIIGAGPSGLTSGRWAQEVGLEVTIFEQAEASGGLWRKDTGAIWPGMHTNFSKFNCMFSDYPWPDNTDTFPDRDQLCDYLHGYASKFGLTERIRYQTCVTHVDKTDDNKWQVTWQTNGETQAGIFDHVIVASGFFSKPYLPDIKGMDVFQQHHQILHSSEYKSAAAYHGKRVVVVGGAFSGAEISADIANHASRIVNVISHPFWVLPRYIPKSLNTPNETAPLDLVFYKHGTKSTQKHNVALNKFGNQFFKALVGSDQSDICAALKKEIDDSDPGVVISDTYRNQIQSGKLEVVRGKIEAFDEHGVVLTDGTRLDADVVILCTGYELGLPYFNAATLAQLSYQADDHLQPILLHKCTFHPALPNLAFVGMFRGPYFGVMELQARWATMVFSGEVPSPDLDKMQRGLSKEADIRALTPRPQFPHGNYVGLLDKIAKEVGARLDPEILKAMDPSLFLTLWEGPVTPAHYRFFGPYQDQEAALPIAIEAKRVLGV